MHRGPKGRKPAESLWQTMSPRDVPQDSTKPTEQPPHLSGTVTQKGVQKLRAALFLALVLAAVQTQGAICCHFISAGMIWDSNGLKI